MAEVRVYAYDKCGTCKKAFKWLEAQGVSYEKKSIVDAPPSADELRRIQSLAQIETRKLFNTSGQSYRNGGWKAKLEHMSDDEAHTALAADGKLIKRPLVVGEDFALVGFKEEAYQGKLGQ